MKTILFAISLALATQPALADAAEVEPSTAFTQAYNLGADAVLKHLQITSDWLSPSASIQRLKNDPGRVSDFKVKIDVNFSRQNPVRQCEVYVMIVKLNSPLPTDIVLETSKDGSTQTVARVNPVSCS